MKEFRLINKLGTPSARGLILGIGDDCAVIAPPDKKNILITTDALYEGVHFDFSYMTPYETGRKASAVNVSDICAMGGIPRFAFVSIGLPGKKTASLFLNIMKGITEELEDYNAVIAGGDTVCSDKVFISITVTGECAQGKHVSRENARPGDRVFVTGPLGGSGRGLKVLLHGEGRKAKGRLLSCVKRHIRPSARFVEGAFIGSLMAASSMIDVSDGLINDVTRICEASKTGVIINVDSVPVFKGATIDDALYGGEDYELIFTVPEKNMEKLKNASEKYGFNFAEIGTITGERGIFIKENGKIRKAGYKKAWKHF